MPIVRISLPRTTLDHAQLIGRCVYHAMRDTFGIPEGDNFQVISQHEPGELVYDPSFYGIERSAGLMIIEVTLARGRAPEVKQRFYQRITDLLSAECGVRPEDVMITLPEIGLGDFSLGEGKAHFLENLPPHLRALGSSRRELRPIANRAQSATRSLVSSLYLHTFRRIDAALPVHHPEGQPRLSAQEEDRQGNHEGAL